MNPSRFDTIARLFAARRLSRRQALTTGGAGLAAASLAAAGVSVASAQDATPAATPQGGFTGEKISYLFVQSFQSGAITPTAGQDGRYTVTLEQGLGSTIYFADRPSREVGITPTRQFLEGFGFSENNPPNAALLVETGEGETDIAVVELYNPTYDPTDRGVTYEAKVLENWEDDLDLGFSEAPTDLATLAPAFGTTHLLIDDCPDGAVGCYYTASAGYAGEFDGLPFCYNYAQCMPCEPYQHNQPGTCATVNYWSDKCNNEISACAGAACYGSWPGSGLICLS